MQIIEKLSDMASEFKFFWNYDRDQARYRKNHEQISSAYLQSGKLFHAMYIDLSSISQNIGCKNVDHRITQLEERNVTQAINTVEQPDIYDLIEHRLPDRLRDAWLLSESWQYDVKLRKGTTRLTNIEDCLLFFSSRDIHPIIHWLSDSLAQNIQENKIPDGIDPDRAQRSVRTFQARIASATEYLEKSHRLEYTLPDLTSQLKLSQLLADNVRHSLHFYDLNYYNKNLFPNFSDYV